MLAVSNLKLSKWNSYINLGNNSGLIYNAFTDKFIVSRTYFSNIEYAKRGEIKNFSPLFTEQLIQIGGLIEESIDEPTLVDDLITTHDLDKSTFNIIINPTLDCNFKCWYCYENHIPNSCMTEEIIQGLILLISNRLQNNETTQCHLSFFGGEPLLKFKEVVQPIIISTEKICNQNQVKLIIQFTSNGYLLNDEMIEFLQFHNTSFQITLDGNRSSHDKTRFGKGNIPSYDTIIQNIVKLSSVGIHTTLRINYTSNNINGCNEILEDINRLSKKSKKHVVVDFQRVWQDTSCTYEDEIDLAAQELRYKLHSMGFMTSNSKLINSVKNPCYADNINELLVNYNGDIFFCTARDFNRQNRAGILQKDGDIQWIGDTHYKRMSCKFRKDVCRCCRIAPICGGGCRTKCMETNSHVHCNLGYSEDDIDNLILDRFINRYI